MEKAAHGLRSNDGKIELEKEMKCSEVKGQMGNT